MWQNKLGGGTSSSIYQPNMSLETCCYSLLLQFTSLNRGGRQNPFAIKKTGWRCSTQCSCVNNTLTVNFQKNTVQILNAGKRVQFVIMIVFVPTLHILYTDSLTYISLLRTSETTYSKYALNVIFLNFALDLSSEELIFRHFSVNSQ